jgi:phosphoribosylamine---glycine ligase
MEHPHYPFFSQENLTIAVIDSGGRGHAIAAKCMESPRVKRVIVMPGNAGMTAISGIECVDVRTPEEMLKAVIEQGVDLTIVGAEQYLRKGIVDLFESQCLPVIGPSSSVSILESSKGFTDLLCQRINVRVPEFAIFKNPQEAKAYVRALPYEVVVKCDGLAEGKGSIVCDTADQAFAEIDLVFEQQASGKWGGDSVVIQKRLYGEEVTATFFCDGRTVLPMPMARDYKRAFDNDEGKNTGGMGGYSPHFWEDRLRTPTLEMAKKIVEGLRKHHGMTYKGFLYLGLICEDNDHEKLVLLEINVRLGDPEAQLILSRIENFVEMLIAYPAQRFHEIGVNVSGEYVCDVVLASGQVHIPGKGNYSGYPGRYAKDFPVSGYTSKDPKVAFYSAGLGLEPGKGIVTTGGRVLHVVGKGNTLLEARERTYAGLKSVSFKGLRFRSDIGLENGEFSPATKP